MNPFIRDGKLVNVCSVSPEHLRSGDVILYRCGEWFLCHRVLKILKTDAGRNFLVQGDSYGEAMHLVESSELMGYVEGARLPLLLVKSMKFIFSVAGKFKQAAKTSLPVLVFLSFASLVLADGFPAWKEDTYEDFSAGQVNSADVTTTEGQVKLSRQDRMTKTGSTLSFAMTDGAAVWCPVNGYVYFFGGLDQNTVASDKIFRFVPLTGTAVELSGKLPVACYGISAVWSSSQNKIYIFGGSDGIGPLAQIVSFDPSGETAVNSGKTLPSARMETSSVWDDLDNVAYIIGGDDGGTYLDEIVKFNPNPPSVSKLGTVALPGKRKGTSAVWDPGAKVAYIFGGLSSGPGYLNDILRFDPKEGTEGQVETLSLVLPSGRTGTSAGWDTTRSCAFIFGGKPLSSGYLKDVVWFNPSQSICDVLTESFEKEIWKTACTWDLSANTAYVLGGEKIDGGAVVTEQIYKFRQAYSANGTFTSAVKNKILDGSPELKNICWSPSSQPAGTGIKFQIAGSKNSSGPWIFRGPDGTESSYYTNPTGENIWSGCIDNYLRYRAYLTSADETKTPALDEAIITYMVSFLVLVDTGDSDGKIRPDSVINISGYLPVLQGTYQVSTAIKDQNERILVSGFEVLGMSVNTEGGLSGSIKIHNISSVYRTVSAIKVEITARETGGQHSVTACSKLTGLYGMNNSIICYNNVLRSRDSRAIIRYETKQSDRVCVRIYNIAGELVYTLVDAEQNAGVNIVYWSGTNSSGNRVASGVYLVNISTPDFVQTCKVVVIR